jgi:hypothetical protein
VATTRITTTLVVEIDSEEFEDSYDSHPGRLLWYALEHGDAGGEFTSTWTGDMKIEDIEETE